MFVAQPPFPLQEFFPLQLTSTLTFALVLTFACVFLFFRASKGDTRRTGSGRGGFAPIERPLKNAGKSRASNYWFG